MRCIFCKQNSDTSKSVEHILPQSLGNTQYTISKGVVCDDCNNYFARKVEKPFLDSPSIMSLRFHQAIPNKKGVVPALEGVLDPGIPIIVRRHLKGPFVGSLEVGPEALRQIINAPGGRIIFPESGEPPADICVSRFLAKAALEAMAHRLLAYPEGLEYVVDEVQLDPVRLHARRGDTQKWPYHVRRIYDANKQWKDETDELYQVVHEFDFLQTDVGEMYFVVAIFGLELALNIGGPFIEGYTQWLEQHKHASPLYWKT